MTPLKRFLAKAPQAKDNGAAMVTIRSIALIGLAGFLGAAEAHAQEVPAVQRFDAWESVSASADGKKICYMGSVPEKSEGDYRRRDKTAIIVSHRPDEKSFDVISVEAGYSYKQGSDVTVLVGGATFTLFTDGGFAWAGDAKTDRALIETMKRGRSMVIKGISSRGTLTTDTYSLIGFTAAHGAINAACDAASR
ncbi:MAG: invasion associated locus B family protein [Rhodospirillales bacterium]|jgi:hypothetical protein|nr:invasion associated locus B family protein [Rhodospirillales bacterium]MDP6805379.1 invasion associated locus B family protein [Rhodospirillales bacterium]